MTLPHKRIVIVVLAALAVAAYGVVRLLGSSEAAATSSDQASVDSMTAQVTGAGWTNMDDMSHDQPGFQMPSQMMPGMPENGDQRFAIAVNLVNASDETKPMRPGEEFALRTGDEGRRWTPHSDTFGELPRLAPHNAIKGTLFFDLPPEELDDNSPVWIEWTHGDTANRLTIPMDGVGHGDDHGGGHSHNS